MHHRDRSEGHYHYSSKTGFLAVIVLNLLITITEYIGGILSGSLALISDAGHNLSDVLSLILGYAGEKVSQKGKSDSFTFGLKRFEVLTALVNSLSLVIIGLYIFYEAVERFRNPVSINFFIMLPVAVIGLSGNLMSVFLLRNKKGSDLNLNVRAALLHLVFDAISSLAVIIAAVIVYFTSNYIIDLAISLVIGVMIIWSSLSIIKESLRIFLQGVPDHINSITVYDAIMNVKGVRSLHGLHIWSINSKEIFLSCHICIDPGFINNSDKIIMEINSVLFKKFSIEHTVIQTEFSDFCGII
jgi:cobalt-zinc-cadmium efflux system protein